MNNNTYAYAGMFTTALRWVVGWTYFSAFWRRVALTNKLDPEQAGYIGEKFNHFLPQALGIKPVIEYLVTHPEALHTAMVAFTIIEGIVGLLLMLGLFTRLMSAGVFGLAFGILLGSGWLGTTCLDEWQIGVLGVAAGFTLFLTGGGRYSLDTHLSNRGKAFTKAGWFGLLGSGALPFPEKGLKRAVLFGSVAILGLTLYTNQYFHGGVFGTLHNLSVKPHVTISDAVLDDDTLRFAVFRDEGADVYGSFLIGIKVLNDSGAVVFELDQHQLAALPSKAIQNEYVAKVKPGEHSLILPLGARATLSFQDSAFLRLQDGFHVQLIDISGAVWTHNSIEASR